MSIAIGEGNNISDFIKNSKSISVFNHSKKLDDWNNIDILIKIINKLAEVKDGPSEYKALEYIMSPDQAKVYNYGAINESTEDVSSENFNESNIYFSEQGYYNEDYNKARKDRLTKAMVTDQPLVDEYDIRCTIKPVFIRKGQYLYDGNSVMHSTSDAKLDKESGLYNINVDILLSNGGITEPTTTISYPAEFSGLKLLKSNPVKPYNESTDETKVDTVSMYFSTSDEAKEFIKDNKLTPEKSFDGKFGWVVILKKSDLKKIK